MEKIEFKEGDRVRVKGCYANGQIDIGEVAIFENIDNGGHAWLKSLKSNPKYERVCIEVSNIELAERPKTLKTAVRYNIGKPKLSLIDPYFQEQLGKVLTMGAEKYNSNDWRRGMPWTEVLDSLERHVLKFKSEDFDDLDEESGIQHMAHVACNAMFLIWYFKNRKEFDDRYKKEVNNE